MHTPHLTGSNARLLAFAGGLALAGVAAAQPRYAVVNVSLPGQFSTARSLSNAGHIAGLATLGPGQSMAYVREPDGSLRTFPELDRIGFSVQTSCSVNDSGVVAVTATGYSDGLFTSRAFILENGDVVGVPPLVGHYTDASAINNAGHVTGRSDAPFSTLHAYLFNGADLHDLGQIEPPSGTNIRATGINDADHVVGIGDNALGGLIGFLWDGAMHTLDALQPSAINAHGRSCGRMPSANTYLAFVREPDGSVLSLGTLGGRSSAANAINTAGAVVGASQRTDGSSGAFLWRDGTMIDLDTLLDRAALAAGWRVTSAEAINDSGQILAFSGAFPVLLTPHDDCAADFNGDGGIDGADVGAFFAAWESGSPLADVSADGGVDGTDVGWFFEVWTAGGC